MKKYNIVILGGCGFVGKHLSALLSQSGHSITVLTRNRAKNREMWVLPNTRCVQNSDFSSAHLETLFQGHDILINLIGTINAPGSGGLGYRQVHCDITENAIAAAMEVGISRYLHMSTMNAGSEASHYLRSKGQAELMVMASADANFHVTCFRPSIIYGNKDHFLRNFGFLLKCSPWGFPLVCAQSKMMPVFVGDVVRALVNSIDKEDTFEKTFNLAGPKDYTLKQLVNRVAEACDLNQRAISVPNLLAQCLGIVGNFIPQSAFNLDIYRSLQVDSCASSDDLKALAGPVTQLETVIDSLIGTNNQQGRYDKFRSAHLRRFVR